MRIKDLGLYRTMKLNYVPYFTDGNGRDRYIAFDNAGFFVNKQTNKENVRRTGTSFDTKISYKYVSPYMKAPNFHYHSDGNGRDSYIYTNGGWLYYDSKPLNSYKLTDFLRGNDNPTMKRDGKVWVSKSQDKYNKILRAKEKDIINRLYENEKKKFYKKKNEENEDNYFMENRNEVYNTIQTEVQTTKLPKLMDKSYINTLDSLNKEGNEEENKISNTLDVQKRRRPFLFSKNVTDNDLNKEMLLKSISKINDFDVSKKLKRINKSFNQAYFHLRNVNYNQGYAQ